MANEKRTGNYVPSIVGVSTVDGQTTLPIGSIPITNVNPLAMALVDGAGTQITSFGGGTQYTEDAAAAADPIGTALNLIRKDTLAALTSTDGDNVAARGTDKGELYVKHADAIVLGAGTAGIGKLTANSGVDIGDVDILTMPNVVIGSGTVTTVTTLTGGGVAHDGADSGNPHKVGAYAANANRTRVANADRTDLIADLAGRLVVQLGHVREMRGKQTTTISASTSETTIVTAAASTYKDLVALIISNTSASTNTRIDFRDTTAGTVLFSLQAPANQTVGFSLAGHSIPQTTVNTNWTAQCGTSTTDIRILAIFENNT